MKLSCVVPCFNEEQALGYFYEEINNISCKMPDTEFELLFVDDGSCDNTLNIIKELKSKDKRVKYISFSRNFGKESAIFAGLSHASGDYVVIMDADLQDPPSLLPEMIDSLLKEDFDIICTKRRTRKNEPPIRSFFARLFYKIINKLSSADIMDGARDFQLMKRKVVDAILSMGEYNRFSKGIFGWVGFKRKWIEYDNIERVAGNTKWNFFSLFKYALEGIVAFSTAPLIWSSIIGIIFCFVAFAVLIFVVIKTLIFGDPVSGWPSLVCLIMLVSGVQLFCMGIIGQYIAKSYLETKKRPIYIIRECDTDSQIIE